MAKKEIPRLIPQARDLDINDDFPMPVEVLREQAKHWGEATQGDVHGEVHQAPSAPDKLAYWFSFVVPELGSVGGYRYHLFIVEHGIEAYPLLIKKSAGDPNPTVANNLDEYYRELERQFNSKQTVDIVRQLRTLVAEARAAKGAQHK